MAQNVFIPNGGGGGGGGGGGAYDVLTLDPGGTPSADVFTTFESVVAAANAHPGMVFVTVKGSVAATVAGTYNLSQIIWYSAASLNQPTITLNAGVSITGTATLTLKNVRLLFTAVNQWVLGGSDVGQIKMSGNCTVLGTASAILVNNTGLNVEAVEFSEFQIDVVNPINGGSLFLSLDGQSNFTGVPNPALDLSVDLRASSRFPNTNPAAYLQSSYTGLISPPTIGQVLELHINPPLISGDQNNYGPLLWNAAKIVEIRSNAARVITGFDAVPSAGSPTASFAERKTLINSGDFSITFEHNSVSSILKTYCPGAVNYVLAPQEAVDLVFGYWQGAWFVRR